MIDQVDANRLVGRWRTRLEIDIAPELEHVDHISEFECPSCGLLFHSPAAAGSAELYRQLQAHPWYYSGEKWEDRQALADIPRRSAVLEVGCGFGSFLELVRKKRHAEVSGIDLNEAAVEVARELERPVAEADICDLAAQGSAQFDIICAFQVLEHVPNPRRFLQACVALLKPGGRLCIGVPNNDGYLGKQPFEDALLNHPPHHITRWSARSLMSLAALFPLKLRRLSFEPLEEIHVPEYLTAQLDSVGPLGRLNIVRSRGGRLCSIALCKLGLRHLLRGHTVYASYIRTTAVAVS